MIQWAKFASKAKKAIKKNYRKGHTSLLKTAKKNPNLVLLGGTSAAAVATYPLVKDSKYMKSRVEHRQKLLDKHYNKKK